MEENNKRSFGWLKVLVAIIITAVLTFYFTKSYVIRSLLNADGLTYLATKMEVVKDKLDKVYIYDIEEDKMIESAIKGYVDGLDDQYTEYLSEKDMEELIESTTGSYVGIGVYIGDNEADGNIIIIGVIKESSAAEAGLEAGDIIKTIDGVEYKSGELTKASDALKGKEEGTVVKVTVVRDSEEMTFDVVRKNIKLKSVYSEKLDNGIGYISISTFNEDTSTEFEDAYKELESQNINGLVIDLRNNGGGLVGESLMIADLMVDKGKTMLITYNKQKKESVQKATSDPIVKVPVVVLINEYTASASEILAGCLRDDCGYKLVGTTSYGKGVIQTVYSFPDGSGLKATTDEYFTPKHEKINKVGVKPDIEVEIDDEWKNKAVIPYENDSQLLRGIEELRKGE